MFQNNSENKYQNHKNEKCCCNHCNHNEKENVNIEIIKINEINYNHYNNECPTDYKKCIPTQANHKPKQPLDYKLKVLEKDSKIPSVIGGYFYKLIRRYMENQPPKDNVEKEVFDMLNAQYKDLKGLFSCGLDNFEKIPADIRSKIFDSRLDGSSYVNIDTIVNWFIEEAKGLYAIDLGIDSYNCIDNGQAGMPRPEDGPDGELELYARVFYVNNLRTGQYLPKLDPFAYNPDEIKYDCSTSECTPCIKSLNEQCEGDYINLDLDQKLCLAIPSVKPGDNVVLKGMNFIDKNPKIKIKLPVPDPDLGPFIYIDGKVCGDTKTPVYETIDGKQYLIKDSRINDTLMFTIPDRFTEGNYAFQVVFKNTTGIGLDEELYTNYLYFEILPPQDTTFAINIKSLDCIDSTDGEWGSDEVGLRIFAIPYFKDKTLGDNEKIQIYLDDVDSGNYFPQNKNIYTSNKLDYISIIFLGHEIDSDDAYEKMITSFSDALSKIVFDSVYKKIADGAVEIIKRINALAGYIAQALCYVVYAIIAAWAPPDLIIQETLVLKWEELAKYTSLSYQMPSKKSIYEDGNIKVDIAPVVKNPNNSYEEDRYYISFDEGSNYRIVLQYQRI